MSNAIAMSSANVPPNTVIDLTLSDSEDVSLSPARRTVLPTRHLPPTHHGLLLEGTFLPSSGPVAGLHNTSTLSQFSQRNSSQHWHIHSKSSGHRTQRILRNNQPNPVNPAKRRRVEGELSSPSGRKQPNTWMEEIPDTPRTRIVDRILPKSTKQVSCSSALSQATQTTPLTRGRNNSTKEQVQESLKVALRQQVFPHINSRLNHYRRAIDSATRRQLGKNTATKICGGDFLDNLFENGGCLSADFEAKIAAKAPALVDQFIVEVKPGLIEDQGNQNEVAKETLSATEHKIGPSRQDVDTANESKAGEAEAAKASRKAKLSAAMKGRWDRGEMDRDTAKRRAKKAEKKARDEALRHISEIPQLDNTTALRPTATPVIVLDSPSPSEDENAVLLHSLVRSSPSPTNAKAELACQYSSSPTSSFSANTLRKRHSTPEFRENIMTRRLRPWPALGISSPKPFSSLRRTRPKLRKKKTAAQDNLKPLLSVDLVASTYEVEKLQLAGLDSQVPRPYIYSQHRQDIQRGLAIILAKDELRDIVSKNEMSALHGSITHVDLCQEEIKHLILAIESVMGAAHSLDALDLSTRIENLMAGREKMIPEVLKTLHRDANSLGHVQESQLVHSRTDASVVAFLQDAAAGLVSKQAKITRLDLSSARLQDTPRTTDSINSILRQRETWGRHRNSGDCSSFKARFISLVEDNLVREAEWTDCAGDIATISWIDSHTFFCGATAHSDEMNMQYNKPGNLMVGSVIEKKLNSVAGHQVVRPIVTRGDNSLAAMRGTQDPWMYCSVTTTAYSHDNKMCFTGSYDQTVKVWGVAEDRSSMELRGTWAHSGNVNFVVASPHHGLIATAADVCEDAIRVYHFDPNSISTSVFDIYEPSVQRRNSNETWAYFPATMQWGARSTVSHLLLVGYSPRSFNCHDVEIPEDKLNTGELCLWDTRDGSRVSITSARTQNVFEVRWHPSQPIFVAATSPTGDFEDWVRTQLRIFAQNSIGSFVHMKTLDCPALDINEVTLMPNSIVNCYVTASCTDGNTYVWDSALSDKPIHTLRHGDSIDDQTQGSSREEADSGVKFAAWGENFDRFYTGSSDGVVKAWNVRAPPGQEFVRNVVSLSGGVSAGAFSPDFGKLVLGDSTGKVHLLSYDGTEPGDNAPAVIRKPITPHAPLAAPLIDDDDVEIEAEQTARERAQQFLDRQQIVIHEDEYVGAVQGPNYDSTDLFYDPEKYENQKGEDAIGWSLLELKERQNERYCLTKMKLPRLPEVQSSSQSLHERNLNLDLNLATLPLETFCQLKKDKVDFGFRDENEFSLELGLEKGVEEIDNRRKEGVFLEDFEIKQFQELKRRILQELEIQRSLKDLF